MVDKPMQATINGIDPDSLVTEVETAKLLHISIRTLQAWRIKLAGPRFVRVGRAIRYRRSDLTAWIEANTVGNAPR
jgi:predicted DNA-binding transcriptional regulator AlpA